MADQKRLNSAWKRHERSLKAWNQNVQRWSQWLAPRVMRRRDYIFVTALPKSGSTLLNNVLIRLTGYFPHPLCDHHRHEQNLVTSRLVDSWAFNSIATHHTMATPLNVERLNEFGIRPVILVRDIFDATVSLMNHMHRERTDTPTFVAPQGFLNLRERDQIDTLIDLALPWHLAFVHSWANADIQKLLITYEQLIERPHETLQSILDFQDISEPRISVSDAWSQSNQDQDTRRNIGRTGRGREFFTADQELKVKLLTRHFPETDFSSIGL